MPELVDVHQELVRLAGDDDTTAAMLTLWNPPPFIVACSQTVVPDGETGEPVLLRNYDYDPHLFEATVYRSRWSSRRVMGTGDCLWGLVDGLNDDGLAVSLTFGGRQNIGEGFGIPLVIRYLLEVAGDVPEGIEVLRRLPHQLSYNVTLCDRSGRVATVFIAPDRPARVTDQTATTNHPEAVEWPDCASGDNARGATKSATRASAIGRVCLFMVSPSRAIAIVRPRARLAATRWDSSAPAPHRFVETSWP